MHWSVDIMAVRCVEKVLDVLNGGCWQGRVRWSKGQGSLVAAEGSP